MPKPKTPVKAYAQAGVDIDAASRLLGAVKNDLKAASRPEVLGAVGGFGGLFDLSRLKYKKPVLVSSTDGVGTKVMLAFNAGKHDGIGYDIVNHCCNDIAVVGGAPLFFLDYYATGKLDGPAYRAVLRGLARACKSANCALIGGETAEMPGFYKPGEYDLVGTIVGIAEKDRLLSGETVRPGDTIIGLASNGLHTNGYSLARKIIFDQLKLKPDSPLPGARSSVATAMLKPHTNYSTALLTLLGEFNKGRGFRFRKGNAVFAAAHITGGGFPGNLPRVLPENCDIVIDTRAWDRPPLFNFLADRGGVSFEELHEVFNMGIGMALTVDAGQADAILRRCKSLGHKAWRIGEVIAGAGRVHLQHGP